MEKLISILLSVLFTVSPNMRAPQTEKLSELPTAIVKDIKENSISADVIYQGKYVSTIDILKENLNGEKQLYERMEATAIDGKFYTCFADNEEILYEFRSNDDTVSWILTTEEIAGVNPDNSKCSFEELERVENIPDYESEYTLIYYDNGTNATNKNCDCPEDWDCECEVYDDIFLAIVKD